MQQHIESVRLSAGRIATALRTGPLDAPVRACPGWDLAELGRHIGFIHRWARLAAITGEAPDAATIEAPPAGELLADWVEAGAAALTEVFVDLDPAAPTWHPFPVAKVAGVWPGARPRRRWCTRGTPRTRSARSGRSIPRSRPTASTSTSA